MSSEIESTKEFRYVIIGNIIGKHHFGVDKEIRSGTKHFRAGAKVCLLPKYFGNGNMDIPVYGLHRKGSRKVEIVVRRNMLKNIRVGQTYDSKLINKIDENYFYQDFRNNEKSLKEYAISMNEWLEEESIEILDNSNEVIQ